MPSITVLECVRLYLTDCTPFKAPATQRHDALYAGIIEDLLGDLHVEAVGPREVDALHLHLGRTEGRQVLANRVLSFVSQVMKLAERRGFRPANSNPTTAVRRYSEVRRTRFLREEQRAPFLQACRDAVLAGEVTYSAALLTVMLLLGGLRWSEARVLQWSELDLEAGVIRLHARGDAGRDANKGGDEDTIPITDDFIDVMRSAPRVSRWVAPNRKTRQPYTTITKPFKIICQRAGVALTPHGLRHAFGSALADAGCTVPEIGACMRHKSGRTTERYIHLSGRSARAALQRSASRIRGSA